MDKIDNQEELVAITVVYGANEIADRRELWGSLENLTLQCVDIPWLVGGDFNTVRDMSEVCGTSGDIRMAMNEFNTCIQNTTLLPLPMQGEWYTWHNRSIGDRNLWKRLDRMLTNDTWTARFPTAYYSCLTPRTSDHSPMVIHEDRQQQFGHAIFGNVMFDVTRKLKALKPIFPEQWRKKGDLSHNVELAKGFLEKAQMGLVPTDRMGSSSWWNFGGERRQQVMDLQYLRPWARHILTEEEVAFIIAPFSEEDVKNATFDIAKDKASGPDGYSSGFYKATWLVIGKEVMKVVLDFFATGRILKQINSTILMLIPKVHSPMSVADYRQIFSCNVLYKIIAKLIVQMLSAVLDKIINPCQAAFVPGRSIGDNILLAQELFSEYKQARRPPRCSLKVDIRAYDTVEWDFLLSVLQLFGFLDMFNGWIEECVTTPSFSVGMNGKPHGFFPGARGMRQGDPLSPYLFVLVMEVLHMGFLQLIEQDMKFTFHWKCEASRVFQLGFADDLLLFYRANIESVRVLKDGLD
ncbi:UNVERIFIED_CONTAM: hypothetical protein Sindi_2456500 [Sesamum indicum]